MDEGQRQGARSGTYLLGLVGLAVERVRYRILAGEAKQTLLSVLGIAVAIALMLVVSSIALGLAAQGTIEAESTDYWIVPEAGASSPVTQVDGVKLGGTHTVADRLQQREDVSYATPVLVEVVPFQAADGRTQRLFLVGIIPGHQSRTIIGLRTDTLRQGDPYFNDGGYNGTWTGQAVISESAARALNVSTGTSLSPGTDPGEYRSFVVRDVNRASAPGVGQLPVVMVHLAEAQVVTGDSNLDAANRILVDADSTTVRPALERLYPHSRVLTQRGLLTEQLRTSDLPLAMSTAAIIVAIVVGVLSIVTTTGFEFVSDADTRAVLAALGLSGLTRVLLLSFETLLTASLGGIVGILVWLVAVATINAAGRAFVAVPLAVVRPEMVLYGLAAAVGIGLVSLPFLLVLSRNPSVLEALPSR